MTKQLQRHFAASFFFTSFSSRLAFMAQLSLPSLYPASIMYHPLKKKRGKQFKTRPLQRNSSHMENCSSRGAAASPAAMERPIRAAKSSQGSAQVGGLLLFWG